MKDCPNCGTKVHDDAAGCPECGARWNEDGTFAGVPEHAHVLAETPERRVADMSVGELRATIFWQVVAALALFLALQIVLSVIIVGCASHNAGF